MSKVYNDFFTTRSTPFLILKFLNERINVSVMDLNWIESLKVNLFRMKRYIPIFLLLFVVAGISAQITVTSSTFPVAGDTLKLAFDNSPVGIVAFTPPGGNQIWDYSSLEADSTRNIVFNPANQGSVGGQVPGAELFAVFSPTTESYYNVTPASFELQAYYGIVPYDLVANHLFKYNPPLQERHAPLNFFDIHSSSSGLLEKFLPSDFTPQLMINLAALNSNAPIDSMRYRVSISSIDAVDAWGSVIIPGGTYDVLREKRTLYRETRIDAKIPPLGWLDITQIAYLAGFKGLHVDTIVSFHFYNDMAKEPIAVVTLNNEQNAARQVMFRNTAVVSAIEKVDAANPTVIISPNPAGDEALISFKNILPGSYRLIISDVSGRMIQQISLQMSGSNPEQINLSRILPGMYLLTLFDENNRLWCQEKLIKGVD